MFPCEESFKIFRACSRCSQNSPYGNPTHFHRFHYCYPNIQSYIFNDIKSCLFQLTYKQITCADIFPWWIKTFYFIRESVKSFSDNLEPCWHSFINMDCVSMFIISNHVTLVAISESLQM